VEWENGKGESKEGRLVELSCPRYWPRDIEGERGSRRMTGGLVVGICFLQVESEEAARWVFGLSLRDAGRTRMNLFALFRQIPDHGRECVYAAGPLNGHGKLIRASSTLTCLLDRDCAVVFFRFFPRCNIITGLRLEHVKAQVLHYLERRRTRDGRSRWLGIERSPRRIFRFTLASPSPSPFPLLEKALSPRPFCSPHPLWPFGLDHV
jgi:hypothetical protein